MSVTWSPALTVPVLCSVAFSLVVRLLCRLRRCLSRFLSFFASWAVVGSGAEEAFGGGRGCVVVAALSAVFFAIGWVIGAGAGLAMVRLLAVGSALPKIIGCGGRWKICGGATGWAGAATGVVLGCRTGGFGPSVCVSASGLGAAGGSLGAIMERASNPSVRIAPGGPGSRSGPVLAMAVTDEGGGAASGRGVSRRADTWGGELLLIVVAWVRCRLAPSDRVVWLSELLVSKDAGRLAEGSSADSRAAVSSTTAGVAAAGTSAIWLALTMVCTSVVIEAVTSDVIAAIRLACSCWEGFDGGAGDLLVAGCIKRRRSGAVVFRGLGWGLLLGGIRGRSGSGCAWVGGGAGLLDVCC